MKPKFFPTHTDVCQWLEENHERVTELLVGFYKVGLEIEGKSDEN